MEYEGDIIPQRRATDRMSEWPTLPELYRNMNTLSTKIDELNAKLSNGIPKRISDLEEDVKKLEGRVGKIGDTQNQCVWGRAGAWRFLTGVFAVAGGITVVMNLVGKFAGWW